jgi:hypothetical protein
MGRALLGSLLLAGICYAVAMGTGLMSDALAAPPSALLLLVVTAALVIALAVLATVFAPGIVLGPHLLALLDQLIKQRPSLAGMPGLGRIAAAAARAAR